jgi:hypothetical protein
MGPIGVGGGGGTPQPVIMSPDQAPICAAQTTTTATLTISPLNIQPGDTVMVGTLISQPSGQTNYVGVTDPSGGNTFTSLRNDGSGNPGFASTNGPRVAIFATAPGGALLTNSVVVTRLTTANPVQFVGCVAVYRNVTAFGATPAATGAASGAASGTISQTLTQANNFLFAAIGPNATAAGGSVSPGTLLAQGVTATGAGGRLIICDNTATTAVQVACTYTFAAAAGWSGVGVELEGGSTGGGGATGVASFNTRTGAVVPATGDYTVAQVTGAAGLASPQFTGAPTAPTPASTSNDTSIATTAFVQNAIGGGGPPVPVPITNEHATCLGVATATSLPVPITIAAGDSVVVFVATRSPDSPATATDDGVGGANTYTVQLNNPATGSGAIGTRTVLTGPVGAAHAATTVTVNITGSAQNFVACVSTWTGVTAYAQPTGWTAPSAIGNYTAPNLTLSLANNVALYSIAAWGSAIASFTITPPGALLSPGAVGGSTSPVNFRICHVTAASATAVNCGWTVPSGSYSWYGQTLELVGGATTGGGGASPYPKVVNAVPESFLTPTTKTGNICPTSICSAPAIYRLNHYVSLTAACPAGTLQLTLHYTGVDGARTVTLLSTPLDLSSTSNTAGGNLRVFQNAGTAPVTYDVTYPAACSSSAAGGSVIFILEQLQ